MNIRAGAHYTQFYVADFDLDGKCEMTCKTSDGTVDGTGKVIGDASKVYRYMTELRRNYTILYALYPPVVEPGTTTGPTAGPRPTPTPSPAPSPTPSPSPTPGSGTGRE